MARDNKDLPSAFDKFDKEESENKNTVTETEDVTVELNTSTEQENESYTVKDVTQNIFSKYQEKSKRLTVEETHTRTTFLFRNDLKKRLDKISRNKKGFKTLFINDAIEALLDVIDDADKQIHGK